MSNATNVIWAERLFERLESLEPAMNEEQYAECQLELLRMLAAGEFYEAQDIVMVWENNYGGTAADMRHQDKLEVEAGDVY